MANRGGARPGAGRKKGKVSKAKQAIAEQAKEYGHIALKTLADIAEGGESEAARVSAANALLDRGYGRPTQAMEHTGAGGGPIKHTVEYVKPSKTISDE